MIWVSTVHRIADSRRTMSLTCAQRTSDPVVRLDRLGNALAAFDLQTIQLALNHTGYGGALLRWEPLYLGYDVVQQLHVLPALSPTMITQEQLRR